MRLFFALTFHESDKEKLNYYTETIANHALKGRFINKENLHLTLYFIGEVSPNDLELYISKLESLPDTPIELTIDHIGKFTKKNRDVVWLGFENNKSLQSLINYLKKQLVISGVKIDEKKSHPHITLGRQVILDLDLEDFIIPKLTIPIKSIALMISHRVQDQLTYEPIEEIFLEQP